MNKNSIIKKFVLVAIAIVTLGAGNALASTVEGTVQGFNCVVNKSICPTDNQDPHIAAESNFVVLSNDKNYFFVPNLDRAILARYFAKKVRVEGKAHERFNSIDANEFKVLQNNKWKTVWTKEQEMRERRLATIK